MASFSGRIRLKGIWWPDRGVPDDAPAADGEAALEAHAQRQHVVKAAIAELSDQFLSFALGQLDQLAPLLSEQGDAENLRDLYKKIFRVAHDLKGQGCTFGYPLLTEVAKSLCAITRYAHDDEDGDADFGRVKAHIEAMRQILSVPITDEEGEAAAQIRYRLLGDGTELKR